jgi:hypothetical protein
MPTRDAIDQMFAARQVLDVHVNVGHRYGEQVIDGDPTGEHVRREYTAADLDDVALGAIGLRTHYSAVELPGNGASRYIPSVALNWAGIDADRVAHELQRFSPGAALVWFQSFRDPYHRQVIDAAYRRSIAAGAAEVGSITHTDNWGRLSEATLAVLEVAREHGAVIATPHANWERTVPLIMQAVDMGMRVLWVHPDSRLIRTPLAVQQAVAAYGKARPGAGTVFVERAAVFLRDGKPGAYSAEQVVADVRAIGVEHILFSSDLGRFKEADPLRPDIGLRWYIHQLQDAGLTDEEARRGLVDNPLLLINGGR